MINSRARLSNMICNNPACNTLIKTHFWLNKGVYCSPWCERNFGKNPNRTGKK